MPDLTTLRDRVRAAEGADREIDAAIFIATTPEVLAAGRVDQDGGVVGWWPKDAPYQSAREVPRYTGSIDAALRLVEAKLPGWFIESASDQASGYLGDMKVIGFAIELSDGQRTAEGNAASRPLAILDALLGALAENANG